MNPDTRTGWDLVAAAQTGDTDAFGELWRLYNQMIQRYIFRKLRDYETAQDLTGDTFCKALAAIGSVTYEGRDVGAWLITIARNNVLDHAKSSNTRRSVRVGDPYFWENAQVVPGPDVIVPQQRAAEDATDRLRRMLSALPVSQQTAIRHRYWEERSAAESAELMGCSSVAAKKMLQQRGLRSLARAARPARTVAEFTDGTAA
jgi:RNA polymerase sigma-70 factor (ECF subfamily)